MKDDSSAINDNRFFLTIFTPSFNRADTLPRCLESLKQQTSTRFEWIIVDDGSTDQTSNLLEEWKNNMIPGLKFPVKVFQQANAGKHIAWNFAVNHASGNYFLCLDSDDELLPEAVESVENEIRNFQSGGNEPEALGFPLVDQYQNRIGKFLTKTEKKEGFIRLAFAGRLDAEVTLVYQTSLLKNYLFPEQFQRIYFPESYLIYRFDRDHPVQFVDPIIYIYHKDTSGAITNSNSASLERIERGAALTLAMMNWGPLNCAPEQVFRHPVKIMRHSINYVRFCLHHKLGFYSAITFVDNLFSKFLVLISFVPGLILMKRDQKAIKRMRARIV
ncbi:MAG: glycosyltransferase family 2 protein, partial [Isosphaeraceae bacterium]